MNKAADLTAFSQWLATLTGGSGAVAVLLTDGSFKSDAPGHRLLGGVHRAAPEHHELCRWGLSSPDGGQGGSTHLHQLTSLPQEMHTDAVSVLKHGVELGAGTWDALMSELDWTVSSVDQVISHQVGGPNRLKILERIGLREEQDFATYPFLGNVGTVSLPLTAALAQERGILKPGQRVAFLGIGSGLNCLMMGWQW